MLGQLLIHIHEDAIGKNVGTNEKDLELEVLLSNEKEIELIKEN